MFKLLLVGTGVVIPTTTNPTSPPSPYPCSTGLQGYRATGLQDQVLGASPGAAGDNADKIL